MTHRTASSAATNATVVAYFQRRGVSTIEVGLHESQVLELPGILIRPYYRPRQLPFPTASVLQLHFDNVRRQEAPLGRFDIIKAA